MRLLSRSAKLAGLLTLLFLLASMLPISWSSSGSQFRSGVSVAWAGSPDETLNPPPEPPRKAHTWATYNSTVTTEAASTARLGSSQIRTGWSWTERFGFVWNYYLSKVLRF
jgi:hypothetical protein